MTETDGDTYIERKTAQEIRETIEKYELTEWDYAIIDGNVIKDFDQKFDVKNII